MINRQSWVPWLVHDMISIMIYPPDSSSTTVTVVRIFCDFKFCNVFSSRPPEVRDSSVHRVLSPSSYIIRSHHVFFPNVSSVVTGCSERLRGKPGGGESLGHNRWSGGMRYLRRGKWIRDETFVRGRGDCHGVRVNLWQSMKITKWTHIMCRRSLLNDRTSYSVKPMKLTKWKQIMCHLGGVLRK